MEVGECFGIPESALLRICGQLYLSHALEAIAGLAMCFFFCYAWLRLEIRGHVNSPAKAFILLCRGQAANFLEEFLSTVGSIFDMPKVELETRFRFCGNINRMCSSLCALLSLVAITRILSIGNINGIRYLTYFVTCPLMQMELIVLIAPFVPCYRLVVAFTGSITVLTLSMGYGASLLWMPVYEGYLTRFLVSWDVSDLEPTLKLKVILPSLAGMSFLSVIQIPFLAVCYLAHGGSRNWDLPKGYLTLLLIVWSTWLTFPLWWLISWEGMALNDDTKSIELGYAVLGLLSKGLFFMKGFSMAESNKVRVKQSALPEMEDVPRFLSRAASGAAADSLFTQMLEEFDEGKYEHCRVPKSPRPC